MQGRVSFWINFSKYIINDNASQCCTAHPGLKSYELTSDSDYKIVTQSDRDGIQWSNKPVFQK